jgi:hypothetical protein
VSELAWLDRQLEYLRKCSFTRLPSPQERAHPLLTAAHTCDNLLLDIAHAFDVVETDGSYDTWLHPKRSTQRSTAREFFVSNLGPQIPLALFAPKLIDQLTPLVELLQNLVTSQGQSHQYHLRKTSRLIEELNVVIQYLLAASDQRLLPPAA